MSAYSYSPEITGVLLAVCSAPAYSPPCCAHSPAGKYEADWLIATCCVPRSELVLSRELFYEDGSEN